MLFWTMCDNAARVPNLEYKVSGKQIQLIPVKMAAIERADPCFR